MVEEKKSVPAEEKKVTSASEVKKSVQQQVDERVAADVKKVNDSHADLLSAAAASGDAGVHQLLGERVVAEQNGDTDALKDIDKKLAGLVG